MNNVTLEDMYVMHEVAKMEFIIEDGEVKGAYIPLPEGGNE